MDKEIWKPIKGYEGYYEISNYGRVKSVERYVQQGNYMRHVKESFKGISADKYGYPRVTLCKNRVSRSHLLHVLLAKAFIPNPECKPQVDHVNTNKGDYSLSNLRWVTPKENSNNPNTLEHCRKNTYIKETAIKANRTKKERGTSSAPKTVYQFSLDGEYITSYDSASEAERNTKVHDSVIRNACDGKAYSAGGFLWSYKKTPPKYEVPVHTNAKGVYKITTSGEIIEEYASLLSAAKSNGVIASNISRSIKTGIKCGGFLWKYKEQNDRAGDLLGTV